MRFVLLAVCLSPTYLLISTVAVQGCGHRIAFFPDRHVFLDASRRMASLFSSYQSVLCSKEKFSREILHIGIW